jgi:2-methylcitrate dehydratase PrpD
MQHALGSAGTQAAGLWEFLVDAADSKVLHAGKAASDGLLSAYVARDGFTGAQKVLEGDRGMAAGMSQKANPSKLTERLGERWTIFECSYKVHACCRHTHPSADALLEVMKRENLKADDIAHIKAHVHRGAIDVLGPVVNPETVHHSKFSMGFVLGLIAFYGQAGVTDFTESTLHDPKVRAFLDRVEMEYDREIDSAPGNFWGGWVEVTTRGGRHLEGRVPAAKGDPQNTLDRSDLEAKAQRLAKFGDAATPDEIRGIISRIWKLHDEPNLSGLLLRREN